MLLGNGQIKEIGAPSAVIDTYFNYKNSIRTKLIFDTTIEQPSSIITVHTIECVNVSNEGVLFLEDPLCIKTMYQIELPQTFIFVNLCFYNEEGVLLFSAFEAYSHEIQGRRRDVGYYESFCYVPGNIFNEGKISVSLVITNTAVADKQSESNSVFELDGALSFYSKKRNNIVIPGFMCEEKKYGVVRPTIRWNIVKQ
jgi:hypothetical protein